ncbi:MAG TPA: hydantoinase/oxoprolinase family protein [Stellaceae bacterium]|nr:hydantoinase/oxoprolinase family protein [Stellaceae bacterium]
MPYLVGVDIGGTFTDCVVIDEGGAVTTAKSPSTPDDFARGMIDAIAAASRKMGMAPDALYPEIALLSHGTTVGTNAIIQKRGAKVGLITTKGHNDVIHIMRGSRGVQGRDVRLVVHFPESRKPEPIVPKQLVAGVSERVDCFGEVVVPLNEEEAEAAIARLIAQGVEAIAICFLWSFLHPEHERRVRDMARTMAPGMFVTCSADLVPKWGEYERTTATALNAYIGPIASGYLGNLGRQLASKGYRQPLQITQCGGGTISVERAMAAPLLTLDSGPVSGVTGSLYLGRAMGHRNIITTDMGGTSFDVGLIFDGQPSFSFTSTVNQYEYFIPKVDIQAIGAGGGSLVRIDERTRAIRVGPESAGAAPGPVCYGRGGTVPTVTDADLVLGFIDAEGFAGGQMRLDRAKAEAAIGALAARLNMGVMECAAGIAKIVEFQMADIIRKMTVGKGFDPRDFTLFAFGGAGPVHAGVFSRELGVARIVIPQRETASVWCAFGAASADVLHIHEAVDIMASPFEAARIDRNLARLAAEAREQMAKDGIAPARQRLEFALDMRHKGQINEVEIVLPWSRAEGDFEAPLKEAFYRRYEQLYGRGASFRGARLEIVTYRVRATAETPRPKLAASERLSEIIPAAAHRPRRPVYWEELKRLEATPIFDGQRLEPGNAVTGPCIVETPDTSVVVRPGQTLRVDAFGNFEIGMG